MNKNLTYLLLITALSVIFSLTFCGVTATAGTLDDFEGVSQNEEKEEKEKKKKQEKKEKEHWDNRKDKDREGDTKEEKQRYKEERKEEHKDHQEKKKEEKQDKRRDKGEKKDKVEKKKKKKKEHEDQGLHRGQYKGSRAAGHVFYRIFLNFSGEVLFWGGQSSMWRVHGGGPTYIEPRTKGEPLIPHLRVDVNYMWAQSDVTAWDYRGELGYGAFGVQFRQTDFTEEVPADKMTTRYLHFLYRMSSNKTWETKIGLGAFALDGNGYSSGFSFTLPISIYPHKNFGIEFKPAWSFLESGTLDQQVIEDYDLSLCFSKSHLMACGGYRSLSSATGNIYGPYLGINLVW